MSVTYYKSEFEDKNSTLIPSAWDNRFIFNMTAGKRFKKYRVRSKNFAKVPEALHTHLLIMLLQVFREFGTLTKEEC